MLITTTDTKYKYVMNAKLSDIGVLTPAQELFPNAEDLVISSREFDEFDDALKSANKFVSEMSDMMNGVLKLDKYKVITEVNPKFTQQETISKNWAMNELTKIWIIDKIRQDAGITPIVAVGLAQLIEIQGPHVLVS